MKIADYNRMVIVTVPCFCCQRGEMCRNLKSGRVWMVSSSLHADRKVAFNNWKKRNPQKYAKLRSEAEFPQRMKDLIDEGEGDG